MAPRSARERKRARLRRVEAAIERAALEGAWSGKGGANDRAVLELFLSRGYQHTTTTVAYARTDLMRDGRFNQPNTVSAILGRLLDQGWLTVARPPVGGWSTIYELGIPQHLRPALRRRLPPTGLPSSTTSGLPVDADAFADAGRGPGKTRWLILSCFTWPNPPASAGTHAHSSAASTTTGALSRRDIVRRTQLSDSTVDRHLRDYGALGILDRTGHGRWRPRPGVGLDEIAHAFGTIGASVRITQAVAARREKHAQGLEGWQEEREEQASNPRRRGNC